MQDHMHNMMPMPRKPATSRKPAGRKTAKRGGGAASAFMRGLQGR